ncbi:sulfatase family protein [Paenibacillus arenilitoris]|uniref:Sulfatase n=1 Tax=Paenibacillus arenilitoris TaxID=2772299 RepID=A0A927H4B2_9BACL|nr:sulfatase [Paenibacillus arenilitoris]MBD2867197.1 sulfatase [Paenibacillus arenilitoris]
MRIVYIDIDSLRPKHIGIHGYHRQTTPNIDRIARQGVRFSRAYCASSPCVPSRASFASGLFGIHSGVVTHWGPGCDYRQFNTEERPMFVRLLREHGYHMTTFSSFADRHDAFWYMAGWNEVHTHTLKKGDEDADEVIGAALPWLEMHGKEDNYFLHLQLWDPHRNYTMPRRYQELFRDEPAPAWPDEEAIVTHQDSYAPFSAAMLFPGRGRSPVDTMPDRIRNRDDFKKFADAYDGAIRFMDEQLGRVFDTLERLGVMDETAIVISGDHGEAMGEHGVYGDHVCADEAVHHIPMIVKWPGSAQNVERRELVYNVDLQATICDLAGVPVPKGWDGRSFAGAIADGGAYMPREYLVWDHGLYSVGRSVRTDEWLMMRTYHPGVVPLEPLELYHVATDPYLTRNIAADRPEVIERLDHYLQQWHHEQVGHPFSKPDPLLLVVETGPFKYIKKDGWARHLREAGREDLRTIYLNRIGERS